MVAKWSTTDDRTIEFIRASKNERQTYRVCLFRFETVVNRLPQNGHSGSVYVSIVDGRGSYDVFPPEASSLELRRFKVSIHGFFRERCLLRFSDLGNTCPHREQVCPRDVLGIMSMKNEKRRQHNNPRDEHMCYCEICEYHSTVTNQQTVTHPSSSFPESSYLGDSL